MLNADTHVEECGEVLADLSYVWTPKCIITLQCKQMSLSELVPEPITHLSNEPLHELVEHLKVVGGGIMYCHYDGSNAYFLEWSYLPCDDVGGDNKQLNLPALVVSLYGGAMSANCRQGALAPHSLPLLATIV